MRPVGPIKFRFLDEPGEYIRCLPVDWRVRMLLLGLILITM